MAAPSAAVGRREDDSPLDVGFLAAFFVACHEFFPENPGAFFEKNSRRMAADSVLIHSRDPAISEFCPGPRGRPENEVDE